MGVGTTQRFSAVRWGVAGNIIWAWILTIPLSGIIAAAAWAVATFVLARVG
jgi:PiT family inorganic phosphate transporter